MPTFDRNHPFFLGLIAIATLAFLALLFFFWQAIFWAVVIGILFHPVQLRMVRWLGGRESLASVLTVILIFFTVLVPALSLASAVTLEATKLYGRVQSGEWEIGVALTWVQGLLPQANEWAAKIGVDLTELSEKVSAAALTGSQFVASLALSAGQNVARFFVMFFLMLYLLFFVLRDGVQIAHQIRIAVPLPDDQERRLMNKFAEVARATIKGTLVVGVVQGFLGGIIFAVLGIQGAVFWGVVMVLLSILPVVGAGLVWAPTAIALAVSGNWVDGVILAGYGVGVIGLVDNILRPILVGRDTKMPDYIILLSTLGGLALVGITGFVLGPVVAALFLVCWQMYSESNEPGADTAVAEVAAPAVGSSDEVAGDG